MIWHAFQGLFALINILGCGLINKEVYILGLEGLRVRDFLIEIQYIELLQTSIINFWQGK